MFSTIQVQGTFFADNATCLWYISYCQSYCYISIEANQNCLQPAKENTSPSNMDWKMVAPKAHWTDNKTFKHHQPRQAAGNPGEGNPRYPSWWSNMIKDALLVVVGFLEKRTLHQVIVFRLGEPLNTPGPKWRDDSKEWFPGDSFNAKGEYMGSLIV